jgi:hypothetical protein
MSLEGFHPLWDDILSQNLQAVGDQGCHLKGSFPNKGAAYRGIFYTVDSDNTVPSLDPIRIGRSTFDSEDVFPLKDALFAQLLISRGTSGDTDS